MGVVTSGQLTLLKSIAEQAMPDTATISEVAQVGDGLGGVTKTETPQASTVICRLEPTINESPVLKVYSDRLAFRVPFTFVCPLGTLISEGNLVQITGDTRQYEVLGFYPEYSMQIDLKCLVVEVTP